MEIELSVLSGSACWKDKRGRQVFEYVVDLGVGERLKVYSLIDRISDLPFDGFFCLTVEKNVLKLILQG